MFETPFPSSVQFRCKTRDDFGSAVIHPEEANLLSPKAVEIRKVHFTLGRFAAREALSALLGQTPEPVLMGEHRQPLWPPGVVGAITHSGDVAIAVAALRETTPGIGIDIEQHTRDVSFDISRHVCTAGEIDWLSSDIVTRDMRLKQIFSAKESVFKAFYPMEHIYLDFMDAELTWDSARGLFVGRLCKQAARAYPAGYRFDIGCATVGEYVFTHLMLPPE